MHPMRNNFLPGPPEYRDVIDAAQALGVREFDFFRIAYRRWWGHDANPKKLEKVFVSYMFHQVVPPWVRQFSRDVLRQAAAGELDPQALGAGGYRKRERPPHLGRLYVALTSVAALICT